ncbi:D-Ala-D-Ala dipeptidase vanX. Metallo peptidase. MEROPS family M15D [Bradyrhizobium sp. NFR13]|jgi:D-alanyl-D-alanine dipeptidase|uniref:M15 family metallopeptidase n=1 Tax=Bradyrhizobium sp. NFR13 TaxID=1566285 RepID=UPI0008EE69E3|nr:M15 family metallopeptidase [Bradyrhizobium sp. NFR13]SFL64625.1 D-Ala-D-Ala dipeptidase vanX. Metallo peptidase. MEROPS family M15D [Bradyrhizobium sp. NFR13]
MRHALSQVVATVSAGLFLAFGAVPAYAQNLPDDFVFLRDIDPSIQQDIRYAGVNNFVGRKLSGYDSAECVVKRPVGLALQKVQRELMAQNLSLKMLDCYRPARASRDMVAWARDGNETPAQERYNPSFGKADLFKLGYIAERSGHSTGAALDLTLVDLRAPASPAFDPNKAYASCIAPEAQRAPEASVDMGTGYDCSDAKAHTGSRAISPAQRRWRNLLTSAMGRQGFVNYSKEWWHFSLPGAGARAYDFPIARQAR